MGLKLVCAQTHAGVPEILSAGSWASIANEIEGFKISSGRSLLGFVSDT